MVKRIMAIDTLDGGRNRVLVALTYLTGGRISEVLRARSGDIELGNHRGHKMLLVDMLVLKKHLPSEKNRRRVVPVPLTPLTEPVAQVIMNYIEPMKADSLLFPTEYGREGKTAFDTRTNKQMDWMSRQQAWHIVRTSLQIHDGIGPNPHYLRHARCSHLVKAFNFSDQALTRFFAWSDSKPAMKYTHMNWREVADILVGE